MISEFSGNIAPFIHAELNRASIAREKGNISAEFSHYENAHVLGQESTYWHVRVHVLLRFALEMSQETHRRPLVYRALRQAGVTLLARRLVGVKAVLAVGALVLRH